MSVDGRHCILRARRKLPKGATGRWGTEGQDQGRRKGLGVRILGFRFLFRKKSRGY